MTMSSQTNHMHSNQAIKSHPTLSIVIPTYNEADSLEHYLALLQPLRARGAEIIVVDGGSNDATEILAKPYADCVINSKLGRALQMNAGAKRSTGECLLFLHADTQLPAMADSLVVNALKSGHVWGRFNISLSGNLRMLPVIAFCINVRSRLTGIATGDQALFVSTSLFEHIGGFPEQPLMEDIELTSRLKILATPACLSERVISSGRRWQTYGVWRTIFLMWRLRYRYWRGIDSHELAREYRSGYK